MSRIRCRRTGLFKFVTFCLVFSFLLLALNVWFTVSPYIDKDNRNPDYADFSAQATPVTRHYDFERNTWLTFFDGSEYGTVFVNATPKLKIVNDNQYYAEVTANAEIHDILDISAPNGMLNIGFKDECYNIENAEKKGRKGKLGLNVDCSVFEIVVHAPIWNLYVCTKTELDIETPLSSKISVVLEDGCFGRIYGLETHSLYVECRNGSQIKIEGNVTRVAEIINIGSFVDMQDLSVNEYDIYQRNATVVLKDSIQEDNSRLHTCIAFIGQFLFWLICEIILIKKQKVSYLRKE